MMLNSKLTLSAVVCVVGAALALGPHQEADASWPGDGEPGAAHFGYWAEQDGITIAFSASQALAGPGGDLLRVVTIVALEEGAGVGGFNTIIISNPVLASSSKIGGGMGDTTISAQPREGLTWGQISQSEDVRISVETSSATVPGTPLQAGRPEAGR